MLYSNMFQGVMKTVNEALQKTEARGKHVAILSCSADEDIKMGIACQAYYKL